MRQLVKAILDRVYPRPPFPLLTPDNLYAYLDAIYQTRDLSGPIVEVGCAYGGTTAVAYHVNRRIGSRRAYFCVDTFGGFVAEHVATDRRLGLTAACAEMFRGNSERKFSASLKRWGVAGATVLRADIAAIDATVLPQDISVALLDVDLRDPTYDGLAKLAPRLNPRGVILVDDCKQGTSWVGANVGYTDWCRAAGLRPSYFLGFGIVQGRDGCPLRWTLSPTPLPAPGPAFSVSHPM